MEGEKPYKTEIKRDEKGRIVHGSGAINPSGRPPGKTLKEFAREMLLAMSDEEKREYMAALPKEIVWKMAEGNPHTTTDVTSKGERIEIPILGNALPANTSDGPDTGTQETD